MSDVDKPGDNPRDVLSKADEFIRRRRAQLGGTVAEVPQQAAADDIPVLTEVVGDAAQPPANPACAEIAAGKDFSAEMALDVWLDEHLPQVVVHIMDGITDKLIQQLHKSAREELLPRLKRALQEGTEASED